MASDKDTVIEGYLEKNSTGVSRFLGKTRFWCVLQGSSFQYGKGNKRSSMIEPIQLSEAQMVRKTSNAKQGTQFEIVMKKQRIHVFTASSAEDCSNWVRHLQQAMIHQQAPTQTCTVLREEHGYEQIDITPDAKPSFAGQATGARNVSTGPYAEVADSIAVSSSRDVRNTGDYAEVGDAIVPMSRGEGTGRKQWPGVVLENTLYSRNKEAEELEQKLNSDKDSDIANDYSTLDDVKDAEHKPDQDNKKVADGQTASTAAAAAARAAAAAAAATTTTDLYAKVNKVKKSNPGNSEAPTQAINGQPPDYDDGNVYENDRTEGEAVERLDMELKRLEQGSESPPVWISLTADDSKPLDDLKTFLDNNPELCRRSFTRLSDCDGNIVMKMKRLVQELC